MFARLGPAPLTALIDDHVEEQRNLACSRYDACLDRAIEENWTSWTCVHCLRFRPAHAANGKRQAAQRAAPGVHDGPEPRSQPSVAAGSRPDGSAPAAASESSLRRSGGTARTGAVSHSVEEESGAVHITLDAPSLAGLFVEAARAVAEVTRGPLLDPPAEWAEEVALAAPDPNRLLASWIDGLVRRSVRAKVRFEEFEIVYLSERQLLAWIRGVRLAEIEHALHATTYHDPHLVRQPGHVSATPMLDA